MSARGIAQLGWILFLAGSVLFVVDAVGVGDPMAAGASVMFVVGVAAFMVAERMPERCSGCQRPLADRTDDGGLCKRCRRKPARQRLRSNSSVRVR